MKPQAVDLHIDELVLDGFAPGDRLSIGDSVERELARLVAENGLTGLRRGPAEIEHLDAGGFKAEPGANAQTIGGQVAQALYRQISSPPVKDRSTGRPGTGSKHR